MKERTLEEHLFGDGPKRILAIDGGGLRGLITLGMLDKMEGIVGKPLSNYFDLIGGTSTGSFIATGLAQGWTAEKIRKIYLELGHQVFNRWMKPGGLLEKVHQIARPIFDSDEMEAALEQHFGDVEMRGKELKTGLAIMAKRLDTDSPWILHNNPRGKYFKHPEGSTAKYRPNGEYRVRDLVRASTAAPTFFEPTTLWVSDVKGAFVDGGVSPHNNPALQLLLLATLDGYGLRWPMGADKLLIVSVGTGTFEDRKEPEEVMDANTGMMGINSLTSLMSDAGALNQLLLQWLSNSPTNTKIDSEVGDLKDDVLGYAPSDPDKKPWISYLRYNATLELEWLNANVDGPAFVTHDLAELRDLGSPDKMDNLIRIGSGAARQVLPEHFPKAFEIGQGALS